MMALEVVLSGALLQPVPDVSAALRRHDPERQASGVTIAAAIQTYGACRQTAGEVVVE